MSSIHLNGGGNIQGNGKGQSMPGLTIIRGGGQALLRLLPGGEDAEKRITGELSAGHGRDGFVCMDGNCRPMVTELADGPRGSDPRT